MTQKWEIYLLARFSRPIAILLIMALWGLMACTIIALMGAAFFALILMGVTLGFEAVGVLICAIGFVFFLVYAYLEADRELPHREKGKDK